MEFILLRPRQLVELIHGWPDRESLILQVATMTLFQQVLMVVRILSPCNSPLIMEFIQRKLRLLVELIHGWPERESLTPQVATTTLFQQMPMVVRILLLCN